MKSTFFYKIWILSLLTIFISLIFIKIHNPITAYADSPHQKVYDNAQLFTEEEKEELEKISEEKGEEGKVDIIIITENEIGEKTRQKYLEDFYDLNSFGYDKEQGDTVLILLNMDPNDRGVEIQGYKKAEHYLHNDRIEHILDDIVPSLSDGDYYMAMEVFADQVAYYMNEEKGVNPNPVFEEEYPDDYHGEASYDGPSNYYGQKSIFSHPIFRLVLSMAVGGIVVGVLTYRSSGRVTTNNKTYLDGNNSKIIARQDYFLHKNTTRIKKPSNPPPSSGRSSGGGGVSSGGHSHSGGGRSF